MQKAKHSADLIIVGGGVLGLFHAYEGLRRGLRVKIFEKNTRPQDASVRNIGCVMPSGWGDADRELGRRSHAVYKQIERDIPGLITSADTAFLAFDEEELQLLQEYQQKLGRLENPYPAQLLSGAECAQFQGVRNAVGGLTVPEAVFDPRTMVHRLAEYLVGKGLEYHGGTHVIMTATMQGAAGVLTNTGEEYSAEKIVICNGHDTTLYPQLFKEKGMRVSKLHVLETVPQDPSYSISPSSGPVFCGLSIRRFDAFKGLPSYERVKAREDPGLTSHGIHCMFKQTESGSVIIAGSHESEEVWEGALSFDTESAIVERLLQEARKVFDLPSWQLQRTWLATYCNTPDNKRLSYDISDNVKVMTCLAGRGMTISPALASDSVDEMFPDARSA